MSNYRRAFQPGGTFFFTLVTYRRARFLCSELARDLLRDAIQAVRRKRPFIIDAMVLLPDHLHALWTLPYGDFDFSTRFAVLKKHFTDHWLAGGGWEGTTSSSRQQNRRRGVWQRRFWEHTIRDQTDFINHLHYIHYNPVKHGHATCPHAWPYSTFQRHVRQNTYPADWCCSCASPAIPPSSLQDMNETAME
jgi:putative transposase